MCTTHLTKSLALNKKTPTCIAHSNKMQVFSIVLHWKSKVLLHLFVFINLKELFSHSINRPYISQSDFFSACGQDICNSNQTFHWCMLSFLALLYLPPYSSQQILALLPHYTYNRFQIPYNSTTTVLDLLIRLHTKELILQR